jgi:hypothetical protein
MDRRIFLAAAGNGTVVGLHTQGQASVGVHAACGLRGQGLRDQLLQLA